MARRIASPLAVLALCLCAVAGDARGSAPPPYVLRLARLVSPRLGVVVVGPRPGDDARPSRVLVTSSSGSRFVDVSPRLSADDVVDDVWFLDRDHGWVSIWSTRDVRVTVYRTSDGGRSWGSVGVTTHSQGAGSVATLQFLTRRRGWLVNQQPTAPSATLSATFDGGARWRVVRGGLPEIAPVEFLSPTEAWQAGGPFGFALFHSVDGGRMWARARLPAPVREHGAKAMVGLPAGHPGRLLVPVTFRRSGHVELAVYRSVDRGRRWRLASLIEGGSTCRVLYGLAPALSASFATGRIWWASVYRSRRWWAYRTSNAGRTWQASPIARASQAGSCPRPAEIQAIDGRTAWFTLPTATEPVLYVTTDGGRRWRRVQPT